MLSGLGPMISRAVRGAGVLLLSLPALAAPPVILLENEHLQFELSQSDGRLVQFTDRNSNWNHVADQASPLGLWKLELRRNGKDVELSPTQAKTFGAERVRGSGGIRLAWRDFQ